MIFFLMYNTKVDSLNLDGVREDIHTHLLIFHLLGEKAVCLKFIIVVLDPIDFHCMKEKKYLLAHL